MKSEIFQDDSRPVISIKNQSSNQSKLLSLQIRIQKSKLFQEPMISDKCDKSVNKERRDEGPERRDEGPERRNEGMNDRNEGTGNEKPYGLVQIAYRERGTRTRHVWTWGGRVTLYLDV